MRNVPFRFNSPASTSGSGRIDNRLPVMDEQIVLVSRPLHPYPEGGYYHRKQPLVNIPTFPEPNWGRTNAPECAESSDLHSLGDGGMGDAGHLAKLPPNPRSDRLLSRPTGVQNLRKGKRAKEATGPAKAAPVGGRTRKVKLNFRDLMAQASFQTDMWQRELNVKHYSFGKLPPSSAVPPVLLWFRKRGTRALPSKAAGRRWDPLSLGVSS